MRSTWHCTLLVILWQTSSPMASQMNLASVRKIPENDYGSPCILYAEWHWRLHKDEAHGLRTSAMVLCVGDCTICTICTYIQKIDSVLCIEARLKQHGDIVWSLSTREARLDHCCGTYNCSSPLSMHPMWPCQKSSYKPSQRYSIEFATMPTLPSRCVWITSSEGPLFMKPRSSKSMFRTIERH